MHICDKCKKCKQCYPDNMPEQKVKAKYEEVSAQGCNKYVELTVREMFLGKRCIYG